MERRLTSEEEITYMWYMLQWIFLLQIKDKVHEMTITIINKINITAIIYTYYVLGIALNTLHELTYLIPT